MFKMTSISNGRLHKNAGWIALACALALAVTACGGVPANSSSQTPTTVMGVLPLNPAATETPTANPTATLESGTAAPFDVCSMISKAEAETLLGQTVVAITPGSDTDSETGTLGYYCTYMGSGLAIIFSESDFGSPAAAGAAMDRELAKMQAEDSSSVSTLQQSGPGDRAYWTIAEQAAAFEVLKGNVVFSIAVGGIVSDPEAFKAGLLTLATSVAGKF